jgi:ketosteroid isomerase-like protein
MSENSDLIGGAYAAFDRGDVPAIAAIVEDGAEWTSTESLPQGGSFSGPEGATQFFQGIGAKWENLDVEVEEMVDAGDQVVAVGRADGKLKDGDSAGYGFSHVFAISDGKIARFREFAAPDEALRTSS